MKEITKELIAFRDARGWGKFHTYENLFHALFVEAGELARLFLWGQEPEPERVKEELADVMIYLLYLAEEFGGFDFESVKQYSDFDVRELIDEIVEKARSYDDVFSACWHLCKKYGWKPADIIRAKIAKNATKYPAGFDTAAAGWRV